jgi:hypothetical protein
MRITSDNGGIALAMIFATVFFTLKSWGRSTARQALSSNAIAPGGMKFTVF